VLPLDRFRAIPAYENASDEELEALRRRFYALGHAVVDTFLADPSPETESPPCPAPSSTVVSLRGTRSRT